MRGALASRSSIAAQWRPQLTVGISTARDVIALTKPAVMSLLILTALGAMLLAAHGVPPFGLLLADQAALSR